MNQVLEVLIESHSHRRTVYCVEDEGWTMQHSTGKKKKKKEHSLMWKNKLSKRVESPGNQTPFYAISSEAKLPLAMGWKLNTKSTFSQMLDEIANFDLLS